MFCTRLYSNSDGAVLMGAYGDEGGWVGKDQRVLVADFLEDDFYLGQVRPARKLGTQVTRRVSMEV